MNDQPTAAQKRWREAVRELGSIISGGPAVIHHPVGRKGKHNKVDIGHWWVIPLTDEEHKALHKGECPWWDVEELDGLSRKEFEKEAFEIVSLLLMEKAQAPIEAFDAIMDYHR